MEVLCTLCSMADSLMTRCSLVSAEVECSQEPEGGVTQTGDGLVAEGGVRVVGPPNAQIDCTCHCSNVTEGSSIPIYSILDLHLLQVTRKE